MGSSPAHPGAGSGQDLREDEQWSLGIWGTRPKVSPKCWWLLPMQTSPPDERASENQDLKGTFESCYFRSTLLSN